MTPHVNPKNLGEISKFRNFLHPEFSKFNFSKFIFKVLINFGWMMRYYMLLLVVGVTATCKPLHFVDPFDNMVFGELDNYYFRWRDLRRKNIDAYLEFIELRRDYGNLMNPMMIDQVLQLFTDDTGLPGHSCLWNEHYVLFNGSYCAGIFQRFTQWAEIRLDSFGDRFWGNVLDHGGGEQWLLKQDFSLDASIEHTLKTIIVLRIKLNAIILKGAIDPIFNALSAEVSDHLTLKPFVLPRHKQSKSGCGFQLREDA